MTRGTLHTQGQSLGCWTNQGAADCPPLALSMVLHQPRPTFNVRPLPARSESHWPPDTLACSALASSTWTIPLAPTRWVAGPRKPCSSEVRPRQADFQRRPAPPGCQANLHRHRVGRRIRRCAPPVCQKIIPCQQRLGRLRPWASAYGGDQIVPQNEAVTYRWCARPPRWRVKPRARDGGGCQRQVLVEGAARTNPRARVHGPWSRCASSIWAASRSATAPTTIRGWTSPTCQPSSARTDIFRR